MRWGRLGLALAGMLLVFGALILLPAVAQERDRAPDATDFTAVTTKTAANRLVREGKLVKIHLFPTELGGQAKERYNISYITPEAAEARSLLISTLERDVDEDKIDQMQIVPDYKGKSIIPTRIRFRAWHSQREGGEFETVVEVW